MNDPTESSDRFLRLIGRRIALARKIAGLTQKDLSDQLGFKDRQILSNIESGKRKLVTDEMMKLMQILNRSLEYFTDPFLLVGEGAFCWRAEAEAGVLDEFETKAGQWIATYRTLGEKLGKETSPIVPVLPLTTRSSYEESWDVAERLVREWNLGEKPSERLTDVVQEKLAMLVLFVDAPQGISGAACHLKDLNSILVNRREPDGRRVYDFAHELFHLLTWQNMKPEHIDPVNPATPRLKRIERLADNFSAALLMPWERIEACWRERGLKDIHDWLNETACLLGVTATALYWRVRNLKFLSESGALDVNVSLLTWNGETPSTRQLPSQFSKPFMERLQEAILRGRISVRRAARLLDFTIEDIEDLFSAYKLKVPFDL